MAEIAVSLIRYYQPTLLLLESYLPTALVNGKSSRQTSDLYTFQELGQSNKLIP
jgi:hypothetical protein